VLPRAWRELVEGDEDLILEALADRAEALSGYKPAMDAVRGYLRSLSSAAIVAPGGAAPPIKAAPRTVEASSPAPTPAPAYETPPALDRSVSFTMFGQTRTAANASVALVEILRALAARDAAKLPLLAKRVKTAKRNNIARTPAEISPDRPDLARAAEIGAGWLVGLAIANRQKMSIIRAACDVYELAVPQDLDVTLPNA
jgi:hypothetical protein